MLLMLGLRRLGGNLLSVGLRLWGWAKVSVAGMKLLEEDEV